MLNQSLCLSHKGEQWTGQLLMWIFCPSMDSEQSVASVCQLQMSRHVTSWHRDILVTSQIQTSRLGLLARIQYLVKLKVAALVSWWLCIAWPGAGWSAGWVWWYSLCFIVSAHSGYLQFTRGPSTHGVCRPGLCCNWTLWPPISEYHRDHDRHTSTQPSSVFSVWRYNDHHDTMIKVIRVTPTPTMTALIRRQRDKSDQSSWLIVIHRTNSV